jgi:hypothetical protein
VGEEATSIGTAFEEARLFPNNQEQIQHALICYARTLPEYEWPALRRDESAPEVDKAYANIFVALAGSAEATDRTFQSAVATNLSAQLGSISTAREIRVVSAQIRIPMLLWTILICGGLIVVSLLYLSTHRAPPFAQGALLGVTTMFTAVLLFAVLALSTPFGGQAGAVTPKLIEDTTAYMEGEAPAAAAIPCNLG